MRVLLFMMFAGCALALVLGACLVSIDEGKLNGKDAGGAADSASTSDSGVDGAP